MTRTKVFLCSLFVILCSLFPLSAQTAAELDTLLETETVTVSTAAHFAFGAAGLLTELSGPAAETLAYEQALSRGWVKSGPEETITLKETAFLLMNVFELPGGLMYSIFRNPRYAYREMVYRKLIQGRTDENMNVSGIKLLQIIGSTLNYTGEREEMDAMLTINWGLE